MALRFSGLLKVMIPTPSVTLCRILPSAKDLSVVFGTLSIGSPLFRIGFSVALIEALVRCLGNGGALRLLRRRKMWFVRACAGWVGSLSSIQRASWFETRGI